MEGEQESVFMRGEWTWEGKGDRIRNHGENMRGTFGIILLFVQSSCSQAPLQTGNEANQSIQVYAVL